MLKFCKKCGCETERYKSGGCKRCVVAYQAGIKERIRQIAAKYYADNREKVLQRSAKYNADHRASIAQRKAESYARDKENRQQRLRDRRAERSLEFAVWCVRREIANSVSMPPSGVPESLVAARAYTRLIKRELKQRKGDSK